MSPMDLINVTDVPWNATVEGVQRRLLELGYSAIDKVDGKMGRKTEGAILNFENRNGLPLTGKVSDALIAALPVASKIELPLTQTQATVTEIAPRVEAVKTNWWSRMWAKILGIPAAVISIVSAIIDHLDDATGKLSAVKNFLSDVPVWAWPALVALVAFIISRTANKTEAAIVDGFQRGTVQADHKAETP